VDLRGGVDDVEKRKFLILPRLELQPLGLPARSQLLYRLRYPGLSDGFTYIFIKLFLLLSAKPRDYMPKSDKYISFIFHSSWSIKFILYCIWGSHKSVREEFCLT
jgi:hypothetical protein